MSNTNKGLPVWQMVKEAVQQMTGVLTYPAIKAKVRSMYGDDINDSSMTCSIISGAVNHPSRIHYGENKKPRLADTAYDYLFSVGRGRVVSYDSEKHGVWEIALSGDGDLTVRATEETSENVLLVTEAPEATEESFAMFALEAHLRDFLAKNLPKLAEHDVPLTLYKTEHRDGVEFQTEIGAIDLLATSSNGDFYVLELKLQRGMDAALGQILRYMGWVKKHLAGDSDVFGVIIAAYIGTKLRYAATQVPNVRLMEYDLKVDLRPVMLQG